MFGLNGVILEVISGKGGIVTTSRMKFAYRDIGEFLYMRNYTSNTESYVKYWKAFCESTHMETYVEGEPMEFNSVFDAVKYSQPTLTETDFETMVLAQMGLQRITKAEYEALITD